MQANFVSVKVLTSFLKNICYLNVSAGEIKIRVINTQPSSPFLF